MHNRWANQTNFNNDVDLDPATFNVTQTYLIENLILLYKVAKNICDSNKGEHKYLEKALKEAEPHVLIHENRNPTEDFGIKESS